MPQIDDPFNTVFETEVEAIVFQRLGGNNIFEHVFSVLGKTPLPSGAAQHYCRAEYHYAQAIRDKGDPQGQAE